MLAILKISLIVLVAIVLVSAAYVRLAPSSVYRWHKDPDTAKRPFKPNFAFLSPKMGSRKPPIYQASALDLAAAFDAMALKRNRVTKLAQTDGGLHVTYIARSKLMAFPDYLSVKFIDLGDGTSTLSIYSRARFGYGDGGVNKGRIKSWIKGLESLEVKSGS